MSAEQRVCSCSPVSGPDYGCEEHGADAVSRASARPAPVVTESPSLGLSPEQQRRVRFTAPQRWCPWCDGTGQVRVSITMGDITDCFHCNGSGDDIEHDRVVEALLAAETLVRSLTDSRPEAALQQVGHHGFGWVPE